VQFNGDSPIPLRLSFKLASKSCLEEVAWIASASLSLDDDDALIEILSNFWILFLQLEHSFFPRTMLKVRWRTFWYQSKFIARKLAFPINFLCSLKTSQQVFRNPVYPLTYICTYGTCILFPMIWFEVAVNLQPEYVKVDAPHHSNCQLKLNCSSDLSMHVYDNHYLQNTYRALIHL